MGDEAGRCAIGRSKARGDGLTGLICFHLNPKGTSRPCGGSGTSPLVLGAYAAAAAGSSVVHLCSRHASKVNDLFHVTSATSGEKATQVVHPATDQAPRCAVNGLLTDSYGKELPFNFSAAVSRRILINTERIALGGDGVTCEPACAGVDGGLRAPMLAFVPTGELEASSPFVAFVPGPNALVYCDPKAVESSNAFAVLDPRNDRESMVFDFDYPLSAETLAELKIDFESALPEPAGTLHSCQVRTLEELKALCSDASVRTVTVLHVEREADNVILRGNLGRLRELAREGTAITTAGGSLVTHLSAPAVMAAIRAPARVLDLLTRGLIAFKSSRRVGAPRSASTPPATKPDDTSTAPSRSPQDAALSQTERPAALALKGTQPRHVDGASSRRSGTSIGGASNPSRGAVGFTFGCTEEPSLLLDDAASPSRGTGGFTFGGLDTSVPKPSPPPVTQPAGLTTDEVMAIMDGDSASVTYHAESIDKAYDVLDDQELHHALSAIVKYACGVGPNVLSQYGIEKTTDQVEFVKRSMASGALRLAVKEEDDSQPPSKAPKVAAPIEVPDILAHMGPSDLDDLVDQVRMVASVDPATGQLSVSEEAEVLLKASFRLGDRQLEAALRHAASVGAPSEVRSFLRSKNRDPPRTSDLHHMGTAPGLGWFNEAAGGTSSSSWTAPLEKPPKPSSSSSWTAPLKKPPKPSGAQGSVPLSSAPVPDPFGPGAFSGGGAASVDPVRPVEVEHETQRLLRLPRQSHSVHPSRAPPPSARRYSDISRVGADDGPLNRREMVAALQSVVPRTPHSSYKVNKEASEVDKSSYGIAFPVKDECFSVAARGGSGPLSHVGSLKHMAQLLTAGALQPHLTGMFQEVGMVGTWSGLRGAAVPRTGVPRYIRCCPCTALHRTPSMDVQVDRLRLSPLLPPPLAPVPHHAPLSVRSRRWARSARSTPSWSS